MKIADEILYAYFLKIGLEDKQIQDKLTKLFSNTLHVLVTRVSFEDRLGIIPQFLLCVRQCANLLLYKQNDLATEEFCKLLFGNINVMIENIIECKIKENTSTLRQADLILYNTFRDVLACDIGDLLISYRSATTDKEKKKIISILRVRIADYNEINGENLKLSDLLEGKVKCEKTVQ